MEKNYLSTSKDFNKTNGSFNNEYYTEQTPQNKKLKPIIKKPVEQSPVVTKIKEKTPEASVNEKANNKKGYVKKESIGVISRDEVDDNINNEIINNISKISGKRDNNSIDEMDPFLTSDINNKNSKLNSKGHLDEVVKEKSRIENEHVNNADEYTRSRELNNLSHGNEDNDLII
jgi:hypothetical protein